MVSNKNKKRLVHNLFPEQRDLLYSHKIQQNTASSLRALQHDIAVIMLPWVFMLLLHTSWVQIVFFYGISRQVFIRVVLAVSQSSFCCRFFFFVFVSALVNHSGTFRRLSFFPTTDKAVFQNLPIGSAWSILSLCPVLWAPLAWRPNKSVYKTLLFGDILF